MTFTWKWWYGPTTDSPKATAIFFIFLGSIVTAVGCGFFLGIKIFKMTAIKTTGIIINYNESKTSDGHPDSSIEYKYIDITGKEHTKICNVGSKKYKIGSSVNVFYLKNRPYRSIYESKENENFYLKMFVVGLIILIPSLVSYHKHKDEEIVWSEEGWHQC